MNNNIFNDIKLGLNRNSRQFFYEFGLFSSIGFSFIWGIVEPVLGIIGSGLIDRLLIIEDKSLNRLLWLGLFIFVSFIYAIIKVRPKSVIEISIPNSRTNIQVIFGDLFKFDGFKAIPMSRFFFEGQPSDLIEEKSLPPQLMKNYFNSDFQLFKNIIEQNLLGKEYIIEERGNRKDKGYELGTTVPIKINNELFLLFALTQTELAEFKTNNNADLSALTKSISGLLETARKYAGGQPINLPLIGSGVSGIDLPLDQILELNILAVVEACKKGHITDTIRIIVWYDKFKDINLNKIERAWK